MIFFDKKSKRREVRSVPHKNFLRTPLKFSAYSFKIFCAENFHSHILLIISKLQRPIFHPFRQQNSTAKGPEKS